MLWGKVMHKNQSNNPQCSFDFEYWSNLAVNDPKAFDKQRRIALNDLIEGTPEPMQQRLRGLQWRIDMEIRRSHNPVDSCLRIHRMMMDAVYAQGGLLEKLYGAVGNGDGKGDLELQPTAKIIPLKR